MATKTVYVDDLDGSESDVETIQFALDDVAYTIDLGPGNAAQLRDVLATYIEHAQRITPAGRPRRAKAAAVVAPVAEAAPIKKSRKTKAAPAKAGREQLQAIREWAKSEGYGVSERGRISQQIRDAFDAAH